MADRLSGRRDPWAQVTFIEAMDTMMPTFDPDIRRVADRMLIQPRKVDGYTSVFAAEVTPGELGKKPVKIKLIDAKTKEEVPDSPLYVDAALVCTGVLIAATSVHLIFFADDVDGAPGSGFV